MARRLALASFATGLFLALLAPSVSARVSIDQRQEAQTDLLGTAVVGSQVLAQTFTAGRNGVLDRVDLLLTRIGTPRGVTVEIHATEAGAPTSRVLASGAVSDASLDDDPYTYQWATAGVRPKLVVRRGMQYAIVLRDSGGGVFPSDYVLWAAALDNPYAPGAPFVSTDGEATWYGPDIFQDSAFRTYLRGS